MIMGLSHTPAPQHRPSRKAQDAAPSLAVFEVVHSVLAPKGQPHTSPGQRPGNDRQNVAQALKGRHKRPNAVTLLCPFRATKGCCSPDPGRCPGLICSGPLGAETSGRLLFVGPSGATSELALRAGVDWAGPNRKRWICRRRSVKPARPGTNSQMSRWQWHHSLSEK